ncbi:hypothetical protein [Kitasatospora cineracea]|uniref:hypothetical protein n=1 Tax=Kitasatospora cineracea TaxID=88074 RepID=UPI0033CC6B85
MNGEASQLVVPIPSGPIPAEWTAASPFAGRDVCEAAGWEVMEGGPRPVFDEDRWDLIGVKGYSRSVRAHVKVLDFAGIVDPAFRLTAKEFVFALLVPMDKHVVALPDADRTAFKPASAHNSTVQLVRWLNFLSSQGITSLGQVMQEHCDVYKEVRSQRKRAGEGPIRPGTMVTILFPVKGLAFYSSLFTTEAYAPGFEPWPGRSVVEVAGVSSYAGNGTPTVPEEVFQPTIAAALYLVETLGQLVAEEYDKLFVDPRARVLPRRLHAQDLEAILALIQQHVADGSPLPMLEPNGVSKRIALGWSPDDPLLQVHLDALISQITIYGGYPHRFLDKIRPALEDAVSKVGVAGVHGRDAALVPRYDAADSAVPWTLPVTRTQVRELAYVVQAACRVLVAAVAGMRASELDELTAESPMPPTTVSGGTQRFKLASKLVKGQAMGGVREEWVVLEPAWRAVQLSARLNRAEGEEAVFPMSPMGFLHGRLRGWVNGPAGQRLGLAAIPPGPVNGRMLRQTLAQILAYRPGGLLAAKIHLKHVSVVTTEGYAHRPGGSQAALLADVRKAEADHHLELTRQAFADYQAGLLPAGPGSRELIKEFAHIDAALKEHEPGTASVLDNERRLEVMLRQQSKALHVQAANYCWFRDPHKALCLKLAGKPDADAPLAGLCDSARCPQATHHPCHLPVWKSQADNNKVFLANPRFPKAEKTRLLPELERAQRVVDEIIAAGAAPGGT